MLDLTRPTMNPSDPVNKIDSPAPPVDHRPDNDANATQPRAVDAEMRTPGCETDRWLAPAQAAEYAAVSRMTIWRWCNERGLRFSKVGGVVRIRRKDLDDFLERHVSN